MPKFISTDRDIDAHAREDAAALQKGNAGIDGASLEILFTRARSHNSWTDRPVDDRTLRRVYEIASCGPTSSNQQPGRFVFVRSAEAKSCLLDTLAPPNVQKVVAAPVVAIVAYDLRFYDRLPVLFPHRQQAAQPFIADPAHAERSAFRNGTLQGAYLMLAARSQGLDIGPLSGFNNAAVDAAFFSGTSLRSNFLCCLGYADVAGVFRRLPRLQFDDVASIV